MAKRPRAGWVFRLEIITDRPDLRTIEMRERVLKAVRSIDNVQDVDAQELFEDLTFFKKPKGAGGS